MDGRDIEPRIVMWAVAEVCWEDDTGKPARVRGTLEDTSRSGACIRVKAPITVGSRLTVKWHREQFAAVARNCRSDGREFLLGVLREPSRIETHPQSRTDRSAEVAKPVTAELANAADKSVAAPTARSTSSLQETEQNKSVRAASAPDTGSSIDRRQSSRDDERCPQERFSGAHNSTHRSSPTRSISTPRLVRPSRKESYATETALSQVLATPAGRHRRA